MKRIARNPVTGAAVALLGLYWLASYLVPNHFLMEALRMLQIAVGVAVVVAYFPIVVDILRQGGGIDRVQQLSLGITVGFSSVVLTGVWFLLWRLSGQPSWMPNSDLGGFFVWMSILAGTLHVTAPGAINGIIPRRNMIYLGAAFGAGALIAATIISLQPYTGMLTDFLRPYLAEHPGVDEPIRYRTSSP